MSKGVRFLLFSWVCVALLAATSAAQVSLANSALFDTPITNSATDANGLTYVVFGSSLYVVSGNGPVLVTRSFPGFTFRSVAVDTTGNIYGAGQYFCAAAPCITPTTVFGTASGSPAGPAALKLAADGSLVYLDVFIATNPTSTNDGVINGLTADASGNAYLAGVTPCGWPVSAGSVHPNCTFGTRLGFVTHLSADGTRFIYSTYLDGANGGTSPQAVTWDGSGNGYVTGVTSAPDFPVTPGAFATTTSATSNGFVAKLDSSGSRLLYSTFLPNAGGLAIAVDQAFSAYVAGTTTGGVPVTPGVAGASFTPDAGGSVGQFAVKLNPAGSALLYATYLGIAQQTPGQGAGFQSVRTAIAVDAAGDAYIAGTTNHGGGPAVNAVQRQLGDGPPANGVTVGDGFIVELNPTATQYLLSTYLGGREGDSITGLGLGADGSIYAAGMTSLNQFPLILQVGSGSVAGSGFLVKLQPGGSGVPVVFPGDRPPGGTTANVGELLFGTVQSGQSITRRFHLGNYGALPLSVGGFTTTGDFSQQNQCPASLNPGEGCDVSVTFTPTLSGARTGTLTANTNGTGGLAIAHLSGTAFSPTVGLSANTIGFGTVAVGATSSPQTLTVTNTGSITLVITAVTIVGDYAQTNTCTAPLPPQATCQVSITFTPSATGELDGTLFLTDNAFNSPQRIVLVGGVTPDFTLALASGNTGGFNLTAGATASYGLLLTPTGGFSGSVSLTCSGAPANATCSVNPPNPSLVGSGSVNVAVTVTTTAHTTAAVNPGTVAASLGGRSPWMYLAMAAALAWFAIRRRRLARFLAPLLLAVLALGVITGCGGGSSTPTTGSTTGTPAGTYTLTVTASSGTTTHTQDLTLIVN